MSDNDARTPENDDFGASVSNIPDSDVIETRGNVIGGGTTTIVDADPNTPGNNPSEDPAPTAAGRGATDHDRSKDA